MGSKYPTITLPNVSTSPELQTLDPERDNPRSASSGEVRQLSGNSSSDEPERVNHTLSPFTGLRRKRRLSTARYYIAYVAPPGRNIFRLQSWRFHPLKVEVKGNCLTRVLRTIQVGFSV